MLDLAALKPVLETAIDGVIVMDQRGLIVGWNVAAERIFGWSQADAVGKDLSDLIVPPRHRQAHQRGLQRYLVTGQGARLGQLLELPAVRAGGEEIEIELSIRAYGGVAAPVFLGFVRDISKRKAVVVELAVSAARFQAAMNIVNGVVWTNSPTGEMLGEQAGWAALTGQVREEYEGFGWSTAVHPDDVKDTVLAWSAAVADRKPVAFEHRVRRADGVWRLFAVRAAPTLKPDGSIHEWIGVHTDITEQRQAVEGLRESEARFRAMADAAPAPVWMTSAQGGVIFANQAFADFAGLSRDALLGEIWIGLIHEEDMQDVLARRTAARAGPTAYSFEARFRHQDGGYRWMLATARPRFGADGQFQGYIGMAMDLTTIKVAEARQRLLINELNHRVKNTLSSVQSIARQTLRAEETPEHVRERFIDRLLAMSAAHDVLTRENWEGAAIDEIARQALRPFVDDQDVKRIELDLPGLKVGSIAALALAMALHELATNAVKYGALSSPDGKVKIDWVAATPAQAIVRWQESGGPLVSPPERRGFGSRLLEKGLTADLGGQPSLSFAPAGVVGLLPLRLASPQRADVDIG